MSADNPLTRVFHQWVTLCQITGTVAPGDYYLRVRSNVPLGASADTFFGFEDNLGVLGNGGNRFAIRAFTSNSADAGKVSVSPYARMPIYANTNESTTIFNLIRVVPESAGANINFTFFDVGDAVGGSGGTMTVLPRTMTMIRRFQSPWTSTRLARSLARFEETRRPPKRTLRARWTGS